MTISIYDMGPSPAQADEGLEWREDLGCYVRAGTDPIAEFVARQNVQEPAGVWYNGNGWTMNPRAPVRYQMRPVRTEADLRQLLRWHPGASAREDWIRARAGL